MNAAPLFDPDEGKARRDEGIERADRNAADEWRERAHVAIELLARTRAEFASDALWEFGLPMPREPRALGAVMKRAQREGWIEPTERFQPSILVSSHRMPKRVWRSLICEEDW